MLPRHRYCLHALLFTALLSGCQTTAPARQEENPANIAGAKETLMQIVSVNDQVAGELYQQGLSQEESGDFLAAENTYLKALKLRPSFTSMIHTQLGLLYHQRGHYDMAEEYLELAAGADPDSALLLYQLALVYMDRGNKTKAIDALSKAVAFNPDWANAQYFLGTLLWDADRKKAADHLRACLRLDKDSTFRQEATILLSELPLEGEAIPPRQKIPAQKSKRLSARLP